ncbi:RIP metalloprotease RseP [Allofustis seminis]|uniref:RIP metalloprotease RseP n=1 Tax=Allofustis seminis TaxID=166939 RepID=UPI00036BCFD2|nr:RIP metalloprotease RseP [Allofustis seminis]
MLKTIISFILIFGVLVFIHELGHFLFAKRAGVFVREFAIGFGPKLYQTKYGETLYTLRMLPLGGYVMMAGDDEEDYLEENQFIYLEVNEEQVITMIHLTDNASLTLLPFYLKDIQLEHGRIRGFWPENDVLQSLPIVKESYIITEDNKKIQIVPEARKYSSAHLLNRFLINLAGPLFNFLLAIIVFTGIAFFLPGIPSNSAVVGEVVPDSPAAQAQLEEGDQIVAIEDQKVSSWNEMVSILSDRGNIETTMKVEKKDGSVESVTITPKLIENEDGTSHGQIGIHIFFDKSFGAKITYGLKQTWGIIASVFTVIYSMLTGSLGLDQLGGPIAIFQATGEVTHSTGFIGVLSFLGFLSVNLGTMNLLPIPGLDGGKIFLLLFEAIRKKPISKDKEYMITLIGVVCILILMLIVTWQDISRLFLN